jgi:hypothetical protein
LEESSTAYDDMMEIMKVWYVITYRSSCDLDPDAPRSVRVACVDPSTGDPLLIVDANGKTIPAGWLPRTAIARSKVSGKQKVEESTHPFGTKSVADRCANVVVGKPSLGGG